MSRIGKQLIKIPSGVTVTIVANEVKVKGPKGELKQAIPNNVTVVNVDNQVQVKIADESDVNQIKLWGTIASLVKNMIKGVTQGYEKKLEINGVGYKAAMAGKKINFNLGFSHVVEFPLPAGIEAKVEKNIVTVSGFDKQLVGLTAARIRKLKKPEPYKGKGIKYVDEVLRRKAGKAAAGASAE